MRTALVILLAAAMLAAPFRPARADSSQGGAFDLPAYGARGWGMAGAFLVLCDDESAVDWNPAGLAGAARAAGASYIQLVEGATAGQSQLVFTMPLTGERHETGAARHAAGALLTNLSVDVAGGESYSENHLRVAYAYSPEPLVSFGLAASGFVSRSGVAGFDGWGTSFDMSGKLSLARAWSVGVVGRNVFSRYTYDDGRDYEKEPRYSVGLAWRNERRLALETDASWSYGSWTRLHVGAESAYLFSRVTLRGGVARLTAGASRTVPAFGVSVRADRLTVHYGASLDDEEALGRTHRVSIAVRI